MRELRDRLIGLGIALAMPALALAQAAAAPRSAGASRQTLLQIFWNGIEWPAYFILAGSIVAISLIVEHFVNVRRASVVPLEQVESAKEMIEGRRFRECLDTVRQSSTFFSCVMTAALQHARHGFDAMHAAAIEKSGELSGRAFRKVEYLNILGNLGPLLGLLGTVWGMIIAFGDLAAGGGGADASGLARGISLALVNTLLGLALAIVGLGFFGVCRNRIDSLTVHATVEVLDLLEYFRPATAAAASAPPRPAAPPPPPSRPEARAGT